MRTEDDAFDDEPAHGEEAPTWRPPARCPECRGHQTRFIRMNYEMAVYECDVCGAEFEAEDEG